MSETINSTIKKTNKNTIKSTSTSTSTTSKIPHTRSTRFYSDNVFDDKMMKKYLSGKTFADFKKSIQAGEELSANIAQEVADAMKKWAISRGATHFTHWFQPLNGITSEKHDSFLVPKDDEGRAIFKFSSKDLIKGEPDASSFPTGGLRATFEARGYTAWDPTSNAFIKDEVLCIPTAFCSYNGEALDKKTPLLRSMDALRKEVSKFMKALGYKADKIDVNIGAEQEFFLIPEKEYAKREDLILTGRTLFGDKPCKGQELEEHYFGSIRPSVNEFMKKLDDELWSLGIAAHTKHNEAAPSQHELAPIFTNANRAIDENLLTMEKMKLLAPKFGLACLLNERPFDGINGSGKHCNWSVTVDGRNLLDPGKTKDDKLIFFATLVCVIAAVDEYQELLRASIASAGNDHRLGANEAPPAIVSIYLGEALENLLNRVMKGGGFNTYSHDSMDLGASVLPKIYRDASDRNRTSAFAFTTNKFEFRMPGSQDNLSDNVCVLNTAFAKSLSVFLDKLSGKLEGDNTKKPLEIAVTEVLAEMLEKHKRILFNGDGYSKEWEKEAERRGLANHKNTAQALPSLVDKKSVELFVEFGVLSNTEIKSRYIAKLEQYNKIVSIEARVMHRMVRRAYLPSISAYAAEVAGEINSIKAANSVCDVSSLTGLLNTLTAGISRINNTLDDVDNKLAHANEIIDEQKRADFIADKLVVAMEKLRRSVDNMEHITSRDYWPEPSYNKMLFYV